VADNRNETKSSKYAEAVNRGTHGETQMAVTGAQDPVVLGRAAAMVRKLDKKEQIAEFAADIESGKFESAPEIYTLVEGDKIEGILEGNGPDAEFEDEDTGKISIVKTWIVASPGGEMRLSILGGAQLDRKLPGFIGSFVKIAHHGQQNIKGTKFRMNVFLVTGEKLPGGKKREWFPQQRPAIDAHSQHALPAGDAS
jgi:hypothetical protein